MTELLIDDYSAWLTARHSKEGTIYHCLRTLKPAADKGLSLEELEAMDACDFYCLITGHRTASRHTPRALYQSVITYREFLWRTGREIE